MNGLSADLSAYVDGDLGPARRLSLRLHLLRCEPCRLYVEQLRLAKRVMRASPPPPLTPSVRSGLRRSFRRWRDERR